MSLEIQNLHLTLQFVATDVFSIDPIGEEIDPIDHLHAPQVGRNDKVLYFLWDVLDGGCQFQALLLVELLRSLAEFFENLTPQMLDDDDLALEYFEAPLHFLPRP